MEHERFFEHMRASGYDVDRFLRFFRKVAFGVIEPAAPKKLRLSTTVALEHFTATFAHRALTSGLLDDLAAPAMRDLLSWHAAEEIEHKAVAFDVLTKVDDRYALRVAGLVVATITLVGFWTIATATLLGQERGLSLRRLARERREVKRRGALGGADIARAFKQYLRRDFHPSQNDDAGLARDYFRALGERGVAA